MLVKKYPWLTALAVIAAAFALYYLSIPIFGTHYAQVCSKGEYGPPDQCADYDIISALIGRLFVFADAHSGAIAAVAGVAVAIFTAVLWDATNKLWTVSERQIKLASDEIATTHRPRLRVRNINVRHVDGIAASSVGGIHLPSVGGVFDGQFYVANIGGGEARILDAFIMFFAARISLPMERPYEGQNGNLSVSSAWLPPGASFPLLFVEPMESHDGVTDSFVDQNETPIYAMGWIEYEDRRHRIRRTAFCRRYEPFHRRFMNFDAAVPDYESEE